MSEARTPDDVLAGIPGWEGASWRELTGGLTNRTYKVQIDGTVGVLKIDTGVRGAPFNTRPAEALVQSNAARAGLAGRVLFADEFVYLTEFVQGTVWQSSCLNSQGNIERLGSALKELHRLPLTGRAFDSSFVARCYVERIDRSDRELVDTCAAIVESMRLPENLCCCHNDLVAENVIATPDIRFLDWEYACDNDPLFDLATIVEHHELGEEQVLRLLISYFAEDGAGWRDKLKVQQHVYLALWWLWLASRADSDADVLRQVGDRLRGRTP